MRTTKRFTPNLLDHFKTQGRGVGTGLDYVPWHRVSRNDPASMGRSHLLPWRGRQLELLSDGEWDACMFSTMVPGVQDIREQYPLMLESAPHELGHYDVRYSSQKYPGTLEIAQQLGIKHPKIAGNGRSAPWVMSTDLLLMSEDLQGFRQLIGIACKRHEDLQLRRVIEKLRIEKMYWDLRKVDWLVITPALYEEKAALTLRRSWAWALVNPVSQDIYQTTVAVCKSLDGRPLHWVIDDLGRHLGVFRDLAEHAFWQAVWSADLPLSLCRGWRPHIPIQFLSKALFLKENPIASGRTAWI